MCYDMLQEVAKEVHSNQGGGSTLDHGEGVDTSHMSVSTTDLPQASINAFASNTNAGELGGASAAGSISQGLQQQLLGGMAHQQQPQYARPHH